MFLCNEKALNQWIKGLRGLLWLKALSLNIRGGVS
jgi:hypothetical protein